MSTQTIGWRNDLRQGIIGLYGELKAFIRIEKFPHSTLGNVLYNQVNPSPETMKSIYDSISTHPKYQRNMEWLKAFFEVDGWNSDFRNWLDEHNYTHWKFAKEKGIPPSTVQGWCAGGIKTPFNIREGYRQKAYAATGLLWFAPVEEIIRKRYLTGADIPTEGNGTETPIPNALDPFYSRVERAIQASGLPRERLEKNYFGRTDVLRNIVRRQKSGIGEVQPEYQRPLVQMFSNYGVGMTDEERALLPDLETLGITKPAQPGELTLLERFSILRKGASGILSDDVNDLFVDVEKELDVYSQRDEVAQTLSPEERIDDFSQTVRHLIEHVRYYDKHPGERSELAKKTDSSLVNMWGAFLFRLYRGGGG